jgi:amino acid transporter
MTQKNRTNLSNILVFLGLLMMAVMAVTPLLVNHNINMELMRWIFTGGAFLVLIGRLVNPYRGSSLRLKRLHVILIFSALLYCASASIMFIYQGTNNWIAFLLAGLLVQLYASWMIEHEEKKTEK